MKNSLITIFTLASGILCAQAPINYEFEILEFTQHSCQDGNGSDEESTWKLWYRDNTMSGVWQMGDCHFADDDIPNIFQPIVNNQDVQMATLATQLEVRFEAWEDDCDGGTGPDRCTFGSCLLGTQSDDDHVNANPFIGAGGTLPAIEIRDSSYCEWHEGAYSLGCFSFKFRFRWEYSTIDAGPALVVGCDDSLQLAATGSGTWSIVSGGSGGFINVEDPNTTFFGTSGQLYTLQWSSLPGCMTNQSSNLDVNMVSSITPNLQLTNSPCMGSTQNFDVGDGGVYYWAEGNLTNYVDTTTDNAYTYEPTGSSVAIYVTIESPDGCLSHDSLLYNLDSAPIVDLGNDTTICTGASVSLNGTNQISELTQYSWNNGVTSSVANLSIPGTYICTLTNLNLCVSSDTIIISNFPVNSVNLGTDVEFCIGDVVTLNAASGYPFVNYLWSDGSTSSTIDVTSFGIVSVVATDSNDCMVSDSVTFSPEYTYFDLYDDTTIYIGTAIDLEAPAGISYEWNTGETTQTITVSPQEDTNYVVTIEQADGCFMVGSVNVLVDESLIVFIPNMFSPNGDQSNDLFLVYGNGISTISFKIYNRWGDLIFESSDVTEMVTTGWDGTYNSEDQPTGTYLWTMEGTDQDGNPLTFNSKNSGSLLLRR